MSLPFLAQISRLTGSGGSNREKWVFLARPLRPCPVFRARLSRETWPTAYNSFIGFRTTSGAGSRRITVAGSEQRRFITGGDSTLVYSHWTSVKYRKHKCGRSVRGRVVGVARNESSNL